VTVEALAAELVPHLTLGQLEAVVLEGTLALEDGARTTILLQPHPVQVARVEAVQE
jgi:hypothetical protein